MSKTNKKTYRLTDERSGQSCMIKVGRKGNLTIFDPNYKREDGGKGARRAIRHCPNQRSIFVDEQDQKHSRVDPVIFEFGYLEVPNTQPITQQFLSMHPSNTANGGGWFEEVNEEKEAKESVAEEELITQLRTAVMDMAKKEDGIHKLSALVAVLLDSVDEATSMGIESLKRVIYNEINADPHYFTDENGNVNIFDDDESERRYIILRAIKDQIIKKSPDGRSVMWTKDSKVIVTAPISVDLIDFFTDYLTSDDGMLVVQEIMRRS